MNGPTKDFEVVEYRFGRKGHYDVASYDALRYVGPAKQYQQTVMANAYTRLIGPLAGKRILDVGCGTGRGALHFAESASLAVGVDASLDMLATAKRKVTNGPACPLAAAYAQQLPFRDAAFDVVTCLNFLHLFSLATQRMIIAEMKRVVRPGGILLLDFANALNGLIIGLYRRWRIKAGVSLPGEIRFAVGDGCRIARVYGAPLPTLWRLFYRVPRLGAALEKIAYLPPLNWLAQGIYCKVVKDTQYLAPTLAGRLRNGDIPVSKSVTVVHSEPSPSGTMGDAAAEQLYRSAAPLPGRGGAPARSQALRGEARERIAFTLNVSPDAAKVERCLFKQSNPIVYCFGHSLGTRFFAKVFLADVYRLEPRTLSGAKEVTFQDAQVRSVEDEINLEWNITNQLRALAGPATVPPPIAKSYSARTIVWEQVGGTRLDRFVAWSRLTDQKGSATRAAMFRAGAWLRKVHDAFPRGEEELDISSSLETIPNLAQGEVSSKYARIAVSLLERALVMAGGSGKLSVPAGLTHGDFCLPNLMWDAKLAQLFVFDFEHFDYGNICRDLAAIIFSLRGCLLNPLIPKSVVVASEESFWAGYGPIAKEMFVCIDALASSRIFCNLFPRLDTRKKRRGWLAGVTASTYRAFLEDYVITRRLGIPASFGDPR